VTRSPQVREHLLALADDEHLVGARHTAWIGLGPFLEEDLAFCSIAQDELGHALALYTLLVGADEVDRLALLREPDDYRSSWLAEAECSDWADALVRHWLYDRAESLRWEALAASADEQIAAIAGSALREEAFHLRHAEQFMSRIAASAEAHRLAAAAEWLLPLAIAAWDGAEPSEELRGDHLAARWEAAVRADLDAWDLTVLWPAQSVIDEVVAGQAGRRRRSPAFAALQADLQRVIAIDPAATW
jgi:ring-1,2-phenylacetyl-CoA epoxidase subunit PaaC